MARRAKPIDALAPDEPAPVSNATRLAVYERDLRQLKREKKDCTASLNERIKLVEGFIAQLTDEILETPGSPTGNLFNEDDGE
jgi:hypothetical protein